MAYGRVASSGVLSTTSGGALTWTHSPTAGNLLTFRATSYNAELAATAVTSLGGTGTFTRDIGIQAPVSGGEWAQIFSLVAPSGVTSVKSATGPTYQEGVFDEWSGNATTSVLDTTASNSGSATSGNAGTLSTGSSAGLVLAALNCDFSTTSAPTATGTGWTGDVNTGDSAPNALSSGFAYKVISGSGSQQMTWTFGSSAYGAVSASYNAASGGSLPVAGTATLTTSASGAITPTLPVSGTAQGSTSGGTTATLPLHPAGTALVTTSGAAALALPLPLAGVASGTTAGTAAPTLALPLAGVAAGTTSATATITNPLSIAGSASGQTGGAATVTVALPLAGTATSTTSGSATVAVAGGVVRSSDQFAGTSGTALTAHTAPDGSAWSMAPVGGVVTGTTPPNLDGSGGIVGVSGSTYSLAIFGKVPTSADYMVQARYADSALPSTAFTRLWLRGDGTGSTGYYVQLESRGAGAYRLDLYRVLAGTATLLASTSTLTLTGSDSLYLAISASGSTITGSWQTAAAIAGSGWLTCSATDTTIAAAGKAGVTLRLTSGVNATLSDFRLQDVGTAYDAALPASAGVTAATDAIAGATQTVTITGIGTAWTGSTTWTASAGTITGTSVAGQVATLTFTNPGTAQTVTFSETTNSTSCTLAIVAAATALTLGGPSGGFVGKASAPFTVTATPPGGALNGSVHVPLSDGGAGGTFVPGSLTLTTATPSATFTYAAATTTPATITAGPNDASNPTVGNPVSGITYTAYPVNAIVPGTPVFTAQHSTIGIFAPYQGDDNEDGGLIVQFRTTGSGDPWRYAMGPNMATDQTSSAFRFDVAWPRVVTAVTNTTNFQVTTGTTAHSLIVGQEVTIAGVLGATGANGTWLVGAVVDTFNVTLTKLDGTTASAPGAYSSGGTIAGYGDSGSTPWPRMFTTKVVRLQSDTAYDLQLTWSDPDGGSSLGSTVYTNITTLADAIPDAWSLTATKYLDAVGGNDANAGTSAGTAWKTLDHALAGLTTNDVLDVAAGQYVVTSASNFAATGAVIRAHTPATVGSRAYVSGKLVGQWAPGNAGQRAVFSLGIWTSPTGSGDQNPGPWVQQTFTGPHLGGTWTNVWKWTYTPGFGTVSATSTVSTVGYAASQTDQPARLNVWPATATAPWVGNTPAGWAEIVNTNLSHNYGAWIDPSNNQDVYLRLPADADPNTQWLWFGHDYNSAYDLDVSGTGQRIAGIEFRCMATAVNIQDSVRNLVIDRCLFTMPKAGIWHSGDKSGASSLYADLVVIQDNYFYESNLWDLNHTNPAAIPWNTIKGGYWQADDTFCFQLAATGQTIPYAGSGDPTRLTYRYNTTINGHDTIALGNDASFDYLCGNAADIYGNYRDGAQDDGPEFTGNGINIAVFDNITGHTLTGCSFNGCAFGPYLYFDNIQWRTGSDGEPVDQDGNPNGSHPPFPGGTALKYGTTPHATSPYPWIVRANNTCWTDSDISFTNSKGTQRTQTLGAYPSGGGGTVSIISHNNVDRTTNYDVATWPTAQNGHLLIEDYNQYYGSNAVGTPTLRTGLIQALDRPTWTTDTGQGAHDQPAGGSTWQLDFDTAFANPAPATGLPDLSLVAGGVLLDLGVPLNNIRDLPTASGQPLPPGGYYGTAPDLGALELLPTSAAIAGTATLTTSGTVTATPTLPLAGTAQATTSGSAVVTTAPRVAGSALGTTGATAAITASLSITGTAQGATGGTVGVTAALPVAGTASGQTAGQATATIAAGNALAGTATLTSAGSAAVTLPFPVGGTANVTTTATAIATYPLLIAGTASGQTGGAATPTMPLPLAGVATGSTSGTATVGSGLSGDIYVGGAVGANILGGAVRAPGPVPLQPGTVYGDGTYGDGLYGPQVLAAGGAVRTNIIGGKVRGR